LASLALLAVDASRASDNERSKPSSAPGSGGARENQRAADGQPGDDLVEQAHTLLTGLRSPVLTSFLTEWPSSSQRRSVEPSSIPALRWLPQVHGAPAFSAPFVAAVAAAAATLAWRRSYTSTDIGSAFLDNYGWTELVGLKGPAASDHLACGLLLLGPNLTYPAHRHEAEEIYVPLAGAAQWKHGDDGWRDRPPGEVIHHARNQPHAMRTGESPMLALYLWRSNNLAQESRLDPRAT
jgi:quercetin dioxygenase-like cupin family protein